MTGGEHSTTRTWLPSLTAVVWVCSWPWSADWEASALHQAIVSDPHQVAVWCDQQQAAGDPLGEALAVWKRVEDPTLEQALEVYSATLVGARAARLPRAAQAEDLAGPGRGDHSRVG